MIDQLPTHVHWENYDFNIVREDWNKYQLEDETILKIRIILNKVWVGEKQSEGNIPFTFNFDTKTIAAKVPLRLRGKPSETPVSKEDLAASNKEKLRFDTIREEWNEYLLENRFRIRIKITLTRVLRTPFYNHDGDPIYTTETAILQALEPPE